MGLRCSALKGGRVSKTSSIFFSFVCTMLKGRWIQTFSSTVIPQHRRHFSAVACEGSIYAVGGWYLDSLVAPDSNTALYTAVESYDPWDDMWRSVRSSLLS